MNLPNITFLFQMLHFLVAYMVLKKWVFRPALEIIEQQESYRLSLKHKLQEAQQEKQTLQQRCLHRWKFIQSSLIGMIPSIHLKSSTAKNTQVPAPSMQQLSHQEKEAVISKLYAELSDVV